MPFASRMSKRDERNCVPAFELTEVTQLVRDALTKLILSPNFEYKDLTTKVQDAA